MKKNKTLCIAVFVVALVCLVLGVVLASGRAGVLRIVGIALATLGTVSCAKGRAYFGSLRAEKELAYALRNRVFAIAQKNRAE